MSAKYLKKTDELQIIRVQKGELGKFPAPHTTTVGDAIFNGDFDACGGSMTVHATHDGMAARLVNGRVSVMVKDAWEE